MAENIVIDATVRTETGKNQNRRLRSEGMIPAILYGVTDENINLAVNPVDIDHILKSKKGGNTLFHINMIGERTTRSSVMIKNYQLDPVRHELIHCDFIRIELEKKLTTMIPVHPVGKPLGVTDQGGVMELVVRELEVECLPTDIPESIEIDVANLMIGDGVRIKDIETDENVVLQGDENIMILHVLEPKKREEILAAIEEAAAEGVEEEVAVEGEEVEVEGEEVEEEAEKPEGEGEKS